MSELAPPNEALLQLCGLAAEHGLGALRRVRLEHAVAQQAHTIARRVLTVGAPGWSPPGPDALGDPLDLTPLLDLASRLLWSRQHAATRAVTAVVRQIGSYAGRPAGAQPAVGAASALSWEQICAGYEALADLTERGHLGSGGSRGQVLEAAAGLFAAADRLLEHGQVSRAALVASAGLWLLFHQELHDAEPNSPLVDDPHLWLRPLRESTVGQLLTRPLRPSRAATAPVAVSTGPRRHAPLVLTGAYPRFAAPVVTALHADPALQVRELALSGVEKPFKRMAVEPWLVEVRLRAGLGEPVHYTPLEEALTGADTVLADWADAAALLASLLTPPGTALTVRVHSVDAVRSWLHLIDWSAVDQVICVGPHVLDLIREQLGTRLAGTRGRVLPNIVHLGTFDHPRPTDTDHTLAMVGWARAVKDPMWTLDLLERLRRHDRRWRLLLIGHGWPAAPPPGGAAYARQFADRLTDPDLRSAVEWVPFTPDLPPVLARAGWVVSSSVRESWGVGPMEAVAAGALPVIRDWPFFGRWGGPRRLYPDQWVVDSVQDAEERLVRVVAARSRSHLAAESRRLLTDLVDPERAAADYRSALTDLAAPVFS